MGSGRAAVGVMRAANSMDPAPLCARAPQGRSEQARIESSAAWRRFLIAHILTDCRGANVAVLSGLSRRSAEAGLEPFGRKAKIGCQPGAVADQRRRKVTSMGTS